MRRTGRVALAGLVLALGGCAGTVYVSTNKSPDYRKPLDRVVVFMKPGRLPPDLEAAFQRRFVDALAARGVQATMGRLAGELALRDAPSIPAQAKAFNASSILLLLPNGGTVSQYGALLVAKYDGQLFEAATDKRVWRAAIGWAIGSTARSDEDRADVLVAELMNALAADGLLAAPAEKVN